MKISSYFSKHWSPDGCFVLLEGETWTLNKYRLSNNRGFADAKAFSYLRGVLVTDSLAKTSQPAAWSYSASAGEDRQTAE